MKRVSIALLTLFVFVPVAPAESTFAGTWETTYGPMTLTQEGNKVRGQYVMEGDKCSIEGTVEKNRLTFIYREPDVEGEGWFELAEDGKSFAGKWREKEATEWSAWQGKRFLTPPADSFTGLWQTSYGRMRLKQTGDQVQGSYTYTSESTVSGKVDKKKLTFTYKEPAAEGEGWFELADDGKSFKGQWRPKGATKWSGWTGSRVEPEPGRIWLVVIEANWESDLAQQEYAFGAMLKSFFTRAPQVQVRHRWFSDEAGLRRWLSEVKYLAEPVVISISSHGQANGVSAGGKIIGADVFADSLRGADNVKVLHFSTCLVMKGSIPKEIMEKLGAQATFPISGYTTTVDWGGSAVAEFMYFDLLLARNMPAAAAAEQLKTLIPFAGDKRTPGAVVPALGFRILTPERKPEASTSTTATPP